MENLKNLHTLLAEKQGEIESWTNFLEKIGQDKTLGVDVKFRVHQAKKETVDIDTDGYDSNPFSHRFPAPFLTGGFSFASTQHEDNDKTEWVRIDESLVYYISAFVVEGLKAQRKELIKKISELA